MEKHTASQLRQLAEHRLRERASGSPLPQGDQEWQRLVAELQIHQYELEIQNEELIRSRGETEAWLRLYTDLYDFAPVSYFTLSPEGAILRANLTATRLLGIERANLIGRRLALFLPEQYRAGFRDFLVRVFASETRVVWEAVLSTQDDQLIHVQLDALSTEDGPTCRLVLLDITDRKRAEAMAATQQKQEQARLVAEDANAAKDRFLAVLSHELRTPLMPVLATISMLQKRSGLDEDVRKALQTARRNIELESRLIEDLLDLTRISKGKVELDKQHLNVCSIIELAVEACRPEVESRGLQITVDAGAAPCTIEADSIRIEQVVWNLLRNAVKFTPRGGKIDIRCRAEGSHAVIVISDTGVGIEPEVIDRIFDAFEQGERSTTRQFGGLGLGLSISKAIIDLHGGTIEAHSEGRNRGARFTVRLPLARFAEVSAPPTQGESPAKEPQGPPAVGLNILLVEDHDDTAQLLEYLLNSEGHHVTRSESIAAALDATSREEFDLLLSDLGLPDGSGNDLVRVIRSRGNGMPAIALSGYGQHSDVLQSRQAGFNEHITKPVDVDRLMIVIQRVAGGQHRPANR